MSSTVTPSSKIRDKLNVSAEDVDDFIQDVITNTSRKTPKGKNKCKIKTFHFHCCCSLYYLDLFSNNSDNVAVDLFWVLYFQLLLYTLCCHEEFFSPALQ